MLTHFVHHSFPNYTVKLSLLDVCGVYSHLTMDGKTNERIVREWMDKGINELIISQML